MLVATRRVVLLSLSALALACLPCCSKGCGSGPAERARVVVSIFPVYDLVRRVAGPDADVALVIPPGRDVHGFTPAPTDAQMATGVKLGVMVGLGLDAWMEPLVKDSSPRARLLKVGDRVPTLPARRGGETPDAGAHADDLETGPMDPHVWLDPQRAQLVVRAIAEELGRADAPHALAYRQRATELDASLAALDKDAEERTRPLRGRPFVTLEDRFQYFAERYHLDIVGVDLADPAARTRVTAMVRDKHVPMLLTESPSAAPAKELADTLKVPLGALASIGGTPELDTYEKLIRFDIAQLEKANAAH